MTEETTEWFYLLGEEHRIVGSWCGRKFRPEKVTARPGWDRINAVRAGAVHEIKSTIILQPGPACLTDGVRGLQAIVEQAARAT